MADSLLQALVAEIEQNQTKLDECQTHSKQYCTSVKVSVSVSVCFSYTVFQICEVEYFYSLVWAELFHYNGPNYVVVTVEYV